MPLLPVSHLRLLRLLACDGTESVCSTADCLGFVAAVMFQILHSANIAQTSIMHLPVAASSLHKCGSDRTAKLLHQPLACCTGGTRWQRTAQVSRCSFCQSWLASLPIRERLWQGRVSCYLTRSTARGQLPTRYEAAFTLQQGLPGSPGLPPEIKAGSDEQSESQLSCEHCSGKVQVLQPAAGWHHSTFLPAISPGVCTCCKLVR